MKGKMKLICLLTDDVYKSCKNKRFSVLYKYCCYYFKYK